MNLHLHISLTLPNTLITISPCFIHQLVSVSGGSSVCLGWAKDETFVCDIFGQIECYQCWSLLQLSFKPMISKPIIFSACHSIRWCHSNLLWNILCHNLCVLWCYALIKKDQGKIKLRWRRELERIGLVATVTSNESHSLDELCIAQP